ncbi:hypothetical protein [Pseudomonas sp. G166]|uniref:hypothetical protein n=1 Tax=Pseudomonas sp. G166 TaxID=3094846 RepID=UPI0030090481
MNIGSFFDKSLATTTQNTSAYSDGGMTLVDVLLKGGTYDIRIASGGTFQVRNPAMADSILREGGGVVQQF